MLKIKSNTMNSKTKLLLIALIALVQVQIFAQPKRHIVIEEGTGTWCQYCPRGAYYIDSMMEIYDNVIPIAAHYGDPMEVTGYPEAMNLDGYPMANVDRVKKNLATNFWFEGVNVRQKEPAPASVYVKPTYDASSRKLSIDISAGFWTDVMKDYRFAAIIIEDGVTGDNDDYSQVNYYSGKSAWTGGFAALPNPVPYTMIAYNHVARALVGGYLGEEGSLPDTMHTGDSFTYKLSYTVPTDFDADYMKVVGVIVDGSTGEIVNAIESSYITGKTNATPFFIGAPDVEGYAQALYSETVYAADPDDKNFTISVVGTKPAWLSVDIKKNKVDIHGTPTAAGNFPLELKVDDGNSSSSMKLVLKIGAAFPFSWDLVANALPRSAPSIVPNIAIGKNGAIYSATPDGGGNLYVHKLNKGWQPVGSIVDTRVIYNVLAVDDSGMPWVAYNVLSQDGKETVNLVVKKWTGTQWKQIGEVISSINNSQIDFRFDNKNVPHLAVWEKTGNTMMVAYNENQDFWDLVGWSYTNGGLTNKIGFDSKNNPYVLYYDYASTSQSALPYVLKWSNDTWDLVGGTVDTGGTYLFQDMAIDKNDNIYVALAERNNQTCNVHKFVNGAWKLIGENIFGDKVGYVDIEVDGNGKVYVLVQDNRKMGKASVMSYDGSKWEKVGPPGFSEGKVYFTDMLIDQNNVPVVSYRDAGMDNQHVVRHYGTMSGIKEDVKASADLSLYPNPASSMVFVGVKTHASSYQIADINGKTVMSKKVNIDPETGFGIDVSSLEAGIYILSIYGNNGVQSMPLQIIR